MNEMLLINKHNPSEWMQAVALRDAREQAPNVDRHDALVQRFRDRNQSHRRRENLFGCVMH